MSGVSFYPIVLSSQRKVGTLFNTYTAAKSVINADELITFPPNYLVVGSKFRVRVSGALSNIVTTPGTVVFQIMIGSIVVWTSGNIQLNATALSQGARLLRTQDDCKNRRDE